mgnify:CR=1 FL=1
MSHFYVTLPCDASLDVHPNNSSSKFVTELPHEIALEGEWEVALSEIVLPGVWNNITAKDFWFEVNNVRYELSDGHYHNIFDVLKAMRDKINRTKHRNWPKAAVVWIPDMIVRRPCDCSILMYVGGYNRVYVELFDLNGHTRMTFSSALAAVLRLPRLEYTSPAVVASLGSARLPHSTIAYVYLDIIEPITVGDTKTQLLRMVFLEKMSKYVEHDLRVIYTSPLYLPLKTKHFRSVEVNIMTDDDKVTPFNIGKSLLLLHFRRTT